MITLEEAEIRSSIIKALASSHEAHDCPSLREGERPFSEINNAFQVNKSTVSKHLTVLKEAGIVSSRKDRHA